MQKTDADWLKAQLEVVRQNARAQGRKDITFMVTTLSPAEAQEVLGRFGADTAGPAAHYSPRKGAASESDGAGIVLTGVSSGEATVVALMIAPTNIEVDGG